MSRSGYGDGDYEPDYDNATALWEQAVRSSIQGRRGQAFLRELAAALDALPAKRLIENSFAEAGEVCTLGAILVHRKVDASDLDPEDYYLSEEVANRLGIAKAMAAEIMFENDDMSPRGETPEQRYDRMLRWVLQNIKKPTEPE